MNPERWQQIDGLLSEVLRRGPDERRDFLRQTYTGDGELLKEIGLLPEAPAQAILC